MIRSKRINRRQLILIVDDQEINRDALGVILEDDYDLLYAENGQEALEIMRKYALDLSLVLLDIFMPVMNGFEVMEQARADEFLKTIPIIVLTAEKSAELQALQMGAADFITKPFDITEVILARVSRIIELSEGRQLINAAEHDQLTGLYSRNFFYEYAKRLFLYHPDMHMDAVVVDIEQFHSINAVNGRDFGDEVLKTIGTEILSFLSETDGIGNRSEGDQFQIYCIRQPDYKALLERLQDKVSNISAKVRIHLRMGVNLWKEGVEPVVAFDQARVACNMARGDYKNPLMFYNDDLHKRELISRRLLNDLRGGVEEHQFQVFYQPKYDIRCDPPRLASAEALIRWKHPEMGMIIPGDFIPLFESNGLISVIDSFVWENAAKQIRRWREKYHFTLPVSVNVSRADLFDPTLTRRLVSLMQNNGLSFEDFKLEITESAYIDNAKQAVETIRGLQDAGFEIEMDDFGSGYSSLNTLSTMPIDVLKMDTKFVQNIEKNDTDLRLVNLILDIARHLKLRVVAEGVETQGQLTLLKNADCDLVQGFYFSRPVSADDFEKLIQQEIMLERG